VSALPAGIAGFPAAISSPDAALEIGGRRCDTAPFFAPAMELAKNLVYRCGHLDYYRKRAEWFGKLPGASGAAQCC